MTDIGELFARDPLDLTKDDVRELCKQLRGMRHQFNTSGSGGSMKKKAVKAKAVGEAAKGVDLKDLGL